MQHTFYHQVKTLLQWILRKRDIRDQVCFKPYSLREFNTNIGKGNYKKLGGLGPNIGTE